MNKKMTRMRRAMRTRHKIRDLGSTRLCIYRTSQHIYAQIISADGGHVLASASTLDGDVKTQLDGHSGNATAASMVGKVIAEKAKSAGIDSVAFDRSGFRYHGRVKALADAARENGLSF
ncbi:MAG: 50S ribosomal protein L18 [gamma proteobacterium symbiont of Bathyaustriella thionipta]|nr:50S ribosomal protein L18 [gamma proteobacterium symbiont of Bathyaustriella thionipta]